MIGAHALDLDRGLIAWSSLARHFTLTVPPRSINHMATRKLSRKINRTSGISCDGHPGEVAILGRFREKFYSLKSHCVSLQCRRFFMASERSVFLREMYGRHL